MIASQRGAPRRLLFLVTEDWYFISHRLPLALAAKAAGYEVIIASRFGEHRKRLEAEGFSLRPISMRRRGASLLDEVLSIVELRRLYREVAPDIIHHVALKPVVFGSLAASGLQGVWLVNAVAGLGFLFSSDRTSVRLVRPMVHFALRCLLRRPRSIVIVQNSSDREELIKHGRLDPSRVRLIPGAGVDLECFVSAPEPTGVPIVAFAGRMLWSKGVGDFVEAARLLRTRGVAGRFVLIGEPDVGSRDAVPRETLDAWAREGLVELWGRRGDMPAVLMSVHVVCLPSVYGEGVPKILLEASACARPIVTTDRPGCRDAVRQGETGLLVPPGDRGQLASALERLLLNPALRRRFGEAGRRLAEREFDVKTVVATTLAIYSELTA
jgi:glycosyltransferase involved in cell wall biosynthesis